MMTVKDVSRLTQLGDVVKLLKRTENYLEAKWSLFDIIK